MPAVPPQEVHRLGFSPEYEVEVHPEFPGNGEWTVPIVAFDSQGRVQPDIRSPWGAPLVLRVVPLDFPEWVGTFPSGGDGGTRGVYATPSPARACVVVDGDSFLVDVRDPHAGAEAIAGQVTQVVAAPVPPLLLLVTCVGIVAVGEQGVLWRSALADDNLHVVSVNETVITCSGYSKGCVETILVEPTTGERWVPPADSV